MKDVGCVATAQKLWSNASLLEQYPQRKGFAKGAEMSSDERLAQVGRDSRRVSLLLRGEEGFPPSAHDRRIGHPATGRGFLQLKPTVPGLQKKRPAEWPYETPQKQKRLAPPVGQCQQLAEAPGPRGKRPLFCFKADESPPNLAVRCPGKPTHQQHHDLLCQTPLAAGQALATSEQRPPLKSISSPGTWQGQPHLAVQQDRSPQEVQDTPLPLSRQDEAEGDTPSVVEETPMPSSTSSTGARASIPPTPGTEEADMLLAACEQYEQASRPVSGPSPMPVKNLMNSALKPAKTTNPAAPQQNGFSEPLPANRSQGAMQNPEGYMNLQADPEVVAPNETAAEDKQIPGARDSSGDAGVESTIGRGPGAAGESNREVEEGELPLKLASYLPQQCLGPFGLPDGRLYQWQVGAFSWPS